MRILLSGVANPSFEAVPDHLASALRRLGHQVERFDHRAFVVPGRLRDAFPALDRLERLRLNAALLRRAAAFRPEVVVVLQGTVIEPATIVRLRRSGARCVNWFCDYPAEFERGLEIAPAYDAFHLSSSYAARRHREAGHLHASWLPFACDAALAATSRTQDAAPRDVPAIVFVGSYYPERHVLLRFLRGLPIGVWGPGWERAVADPHLAPMIRGGALRPGAWARLYAGCRVALNIHYGAFGPLEASGDLASTRVFEILGCGAYQVVNRQGDVLRLFRDGEHLAAFQSGDELRSRVEEALRDEGTRRAVAARGQDAVLARHTYAHRARALLDPAAPRVISEEPGTARPSAAAGAR